MSSIFQTECPLCSSTVKTDVFFENDNNEIYVKCPECNHKIVLKIKKEQIYLNQDSDTCPKCGAIKTENAESCPKCGLIYEKWSGENEPFTDYPSIYEKWQNVKKEDLKSEVHDLFLEECFNTGILGEAAKAYRVLEKEQNEDVSSRLRQIRILAQMRIPVTTEKKQSKINWIYLIIMIAFGIFFIWVLGK